MKNHDFTQKDHIFSNFRGAPGSRNIDGHIGTKYDTMRNIDGHILAKYDTMRNIDGHSVQSTI